jgi:hypothetical protein
MASSAGNLPFDVTRIAATRQLGQCTSVHKVGSAPRTIAIAAAVVAGLAVLIGVRNSLGVGSPGLSAVLSAFLCMGVICAIAFLVTGLVHVGEAVYLYQEGLVYVDRTSVTAIRFDEIRSLERIASRSAETMVGRVSYRVVGGGYSIRVTGLVDRSVALGQRLENEVRRHGGLVT